jgi:hypothetical protein
VEALLAAQDPIAELSQIAMSSGRVHDLAELQERRAHLATTGLDFAATAEPAAARSLVVNAAAAVTDWLAAQGRVDRLAWPPTTKSHPPTPSSTTSR